MQISPIAAPLTPRTVPPASQSNFRIPRASLNRATDNADDSRDVGELEYDDHPDRPRAARNHRRYSPYKVSRASSDASHPQNAARHVSRGVPVHRGPPKTMLERECRSFLANDAAELLTIQIRGTSSTVPTPWLTQMGSRTSTSITTIVSVTVSLNLLYPSLYALLAQRLRIITRLRGKSPTPEPELPPPRALP